MEKGRMNGEGKDERRREGWKEMGMKNGERKKEWGREERMTGEEKDERRREGWMEKGRKNGERKDK